MSRRAILPGIVALLAIFAPAEARAEGAAIPLGPADRLTFQAGHLDADPGLAELTLRDHVELRYGRYRITGEALRLKLGERRIGFEGDGRVALCPCADPPVAFAWSGGWVEAPGDLFVRFPRLELFGVPVFALPFLWLRTPDLPGFLPPTLALRGADGLLAGTGVHLPLARTAAGRSALDLTAAAYFKGGAELGAELSTPGGTARVVADEIHGDRVVLAARGAVAPPGGAWLAWDADAIRGDRARRGTVELAAAALPFDHAAVETGLGARVGPVRAVASAGVIARAFRGEGAIAAGPTAGASAGGSLGALGSWSASAGGVLLARPDEAALPLGRAALSAVIDARPGPLGLRAEAGARAWIAGDDPAAPSRDLAAGARIEASLPLYRDFGAPGAAALRHWIAPAIELAGAAVATRGGFFAPLAAWPSPGLGIAAAGLSTSLGRGASAARLDLRAGAAVAAPGVSALACGRLAAAAPLAAASIELAAVRGPARAVGSALIGRARLGPEGGASLRIELAGQTGDGAREARSLASEHGAVPGGEIDYLAVAGWSGGAGVSIPWTAAIRTGARADIDLAAGRLLAVGGSADYRHPCGCLGLGARAAHRAGRDGVDLTVSVDLAPGPGFSGLFGANR